MKWFDIPRDEQETLINIDYCEKTLTVYTTRKATAKRLLNKVGEPTRYDMHDGLISSVTYERSLFDKDVAKFFSKSLLIGGFRQNKDKEV